MAKRISRKTYEFISQTIKNTIMATAIKKKKQQPKKQESALSRINAGLGMAIKNKIPRESATLTLMLIEIQMLENRIAYLEERI